MPNGQTLDAKPLCNGDHPDGNLNGNLSGADHPVPIAIVGMSCRFAGDATCPSKLWEVCVNGKSAWSPVPADRFDADAIYDPDPEKPGRVSWIGYLKNAIILRILAPRPWRTLLFRGP